MPVIERVSAFGGGAAMVNPLPMLLALDLASKRTGWCLFRDERDWRAGSELHAGASLVARLDSLHAWLDALIDREGPPAVWVEVPDFGRRAIRNHPATLKALYMAHGVVCTTTFGRERIIDLHERDAGTVRELLVGHATASKLDVQITLRRRGFALPLRDGRPDHDACDALALAVTVHDEMRQRALAVGDA